MHARNAAEFKRPAMPRGQQRERGRQWPHGGAGIAQKQLALPHRELPIQAVHAQRAVVLRFDAAAQLRQGVEHHACVVGIEQIGDVRMAHAERGEQQHPVGDALGAGQADGAARAGQWRDVEMWNGKHARR
ncbi:hypothetical protein D9M68_928630 [compost metagenome]